MGFLSHLGQKAHMLDVILRNRSRYKHMDAFTQNVLRGPSAFSVKERETMASFVSALNACQYCTGIHVEVAKNFGMEASLIEALLEDIDGAPVEEKMKPVFKYVKKLTQTPSKVIQADADAIVQAGWPESGVEDTVVITALFNYYNRLMDGLGMKGYQEIFTEGAGFLSKRGYVIPGPVAWYLKRFGFKKD